MTMTSPYSPRTGSVAFRALEILRANPEQQYSSGELAELLSTAATGIVSQLTPLVQHQLAAKVMGRAGRVSWQFIDPADDGQPDRRLVNAASAPPLGKRGPNSVFDLAASAPDAPAVHAERVPPTEHPTTWRAAPRKKARSVAVAVPAAPRAAAPKPRAAFIESLEPDLSCAMFNTGDLLIEAPGQQPLRLSPRQCGDLVAYLQRFHGAAAPAA